MSPDQAVLEANKALHTADFLDSVTECCPLAPEVAEDKYSLQTATDMHAIEALRPCWRMWANSLDTDLDFFLHQLSQDSTVLEPYVITVYNMGIARAMLVGQIRKRRASAVVSFVNIPGPIERVLVIKKGGRMGQPSPVVDRLLALELLKAMKRGDADSTCFERLPLKSALFQEIQQLTGFLIKKRVPHLFCYSVLSLTTQERKLDRFFTGKTIREMRRKTRIVERAFPGQVSLKYFSQPGEIDDGMRDAMRVAVTTWQHYLGQGLTDTAKTRETFLFLAKRGWLRIYVLYIKDAPCAFLVGQLYDNTFYCQYAGYHPDYGGFSVGSLLTARAFEDLAAAGVESVDLGEGGQEHNRRLGCQISVEGNVHVYSPTLRGLCMSLFFGTTQIVRAGGRRTRSILHLDWIGRTFKSSLIARWARKRQSLAVVDGPSPELLHRKD